MSSGWLGLIESTYCRRGLSAKRRIETGSSASEALKRNADQQL